MKCPNCHEGYIYGMRICIPCPICRGTSELPKDMIYDPKRGQALKARRHRQGLTLRDWCHDNSVTDAADRAHKERGYFKKDD